MGKAAKGQRRGIARGVDARGEEEGTFYPAAAFSLKRRLLFGAMGGRDGPERSKTNEKEACDAPVLEGDAHDGKPRLASKTRAGAGVLEE